MVKRRRAPKDDTGLVEASEREAAEAALARAAAAGELPEESDEEKLLATVSETSVKHNKALHDDAARRIADWADNEAKQSRWLTSRGGGLEPLLKDQPSGLIRMQDFFPQDIADAVLKVIESLPESDWELSEQGGEADAARHRFWSADLMEIPALAPLRSVFWRMLRSFGGEGTLPIFSIGRYGNSDYIGGHDDRAHVPFNSEDNIFSRTVAGIWYLTREWSAEEGGALVDLEPPENTADPRLVPVYNSLVIFKVPHMHAVEPVSSDRYRYSVFGWWHQAGRRYELPDVGLESGSKPKKAKAKAKGKVKKKTKAKKPKAKADKQ